MRDLEFADINASRICRLAWADKAERSYRPAVRAALLTAVSIMTVAPMPGIAGDVAAGQIKYVLCAGCHGPTGAGNAALQYPRLAGLDAVYVAQQLRAFKDGARENATMKAMTAGLSDADIENLGAYVATLK